MAAYRRCGGFLAEGEMENGRPREDREAYITGVGMVTPVGIGREAFWGALMRCESGMGQISSFDTDGYEVKIAAECDGFDPSDFMDRKAVQRMDRFAQLALAASKLALDDAGAWGELEKAPERAGIIVGSGIGGAGSMETTQKTIDEKGPMRVNPFAVTRIMPNAAAAHVGIQLGIQGPSTAGTLACTCGTDMVALGVDMIRRGDADLVLCGASEATITPVIVAGFIAMRAMSRNNADPEGACRPYDKDHSGFVIGEGAGIVVLESRESVESRGAAPYAKLTGIGRTTDAFHVFDPDPKGRGIHGAMKLALESAGVEGERVGFISPHGTGTVAGDGPESQAMHRINPNAMVSATKSTLGHSLGATGAIETAICALALRERAVPPMRNLGEIAEDCAPLDYVVDELRQAPDLEVAMCANLGVGGHNAAIVLEQPS